MSDRLTTEEPPPYSAAVNIPPQPMVSNAAYPPSHQAQYTPQPEGQYSIQPQKRYQPQGAYPTQPQGTYPTQPQGMYPAQPQGMYPTQPRGAYPTQPQGAYPTQPQGAYPTQANIPIVQQQQSTSNVVLVTGQPGVVVGGTQVSRKPENYLYLSLVSLFCFCWIFGIIALIYSMQVDSAWARGDVAAAHQSSRNAKGWNIAAIVGGIIAIVVIIVISVASNSLRYSYYY